METRGQIMMVEGDYNNLMDLERLKDKTAIMMYKHFDSYPEENLRIIAQIIADCEVKTAHDIGVCQLLIIESFTELGAELEMDDNEVAETELHGDIEWLYGLYNNVVVVFCVSNWGYCCNYVVPIGVYSYEKLHTMSEEDTLSECERLNRLARVVSDARSVIMEIGDKAIYSR